MTLFYVVHVLSLLSIFLYVKQERCTKAFCEVAKQCWF